MRKLFTPIVEASIGADVQLPLSYGQISIRAIADDDLEEYLGIKDRKREDDGSWGYTSIGAHNRLRTLGTLRGIKVRTSVLAFVSELPRESHIHEISRIVTAWRMLQESKVAIPATLNSESPSLYVTNPTECKLGGALVLTSQLIEETRHLIDVVGNLDKSDLEMLNQINEIGYTQLSLTLLVIMLERMIMEGDRNEIRFKVAFYASRILADEGYSSYDVFTLVNNAYNARSAFVHSRARPPQDLPSLISDLYKHVVLLSKIYLKEPARFSQQNRLRYATRA